MDREWYEVAMEVIKSIVALLVENPGDVDVKMKTYETKSGTRYIFEVRLNESDIPFVIGRKGTRIKNLRSLIGSIAKKNGAAYALIKIIE